MPAGRRGGASPCWAGYRRAPPPPSRTHRPRRRQRGRRSDGPSASAGATRAGSRLSRGVAHAGFGLLATTWTARHDAADRAELHAVPMSTRIAARQPAHDSAAHAVAAEAAHEDDRLGAGAGAGAGGRRRRETPPSQPGRSGITPRLRPCIRAPARLALPVVGMGGPPGAVVGTPPLGVMPAPAARTGPGREPVLHARSLGRGPAQRGAVGGPDDGAGQGERHDVRRWMAWSTFTT